MGPYQNAHGPLSTATSVALPMPSLTSTPSSDTDLTVPRAINEHLQMKHVECSLLCCDSDISTSKATVTALLMKNMAKDVAEPVDFLDIISSWLFVGTKLGTGNKIGV